MLHSAITNNLPQWAFLHRWRALPETFVHFLMFIDTFKSFSLTFYCFYKPIFLTNHNVQFLYSLLKIMQQTCNGMTRTWYFAIIPADIIQNYPNTTRRFAARGILNNFEISHAVLLPGTMLLYTNFASCRAQKAFWLELKLALCLKSGIIKTL